MTAKKLREARLAAGLTMKRAADFSGTPYRTWQDWETGKHRVPGIAGAWLKLYIELKASESPCMRLRTGRFINRDEM